MNDQLELKCGHALRYDAQPVISSPPKARRYWCPECRKLVAEKK
jgi:hypothetical protein